MRKFINIEYENNGRKSSINGENITEHKTILNIRHVQKYLPSIDLVIRLSKVMNLGPIWLPRAQRVAIHSSYISDWGGTAAVVICV